MQLVLADTSVWIDFFRMRISLESSKLAGYLDQDRICTTAIIKAEILSGTRNEREYNLLKENLSALPVLDEPDDLWDSVAHFRFLLARKGIQSSMIDLAIAFLAYQHDSLLLTRDKEFKRISAVLPFKFT